MYLDHERRVSTEYLNKRHTNDEMIKYLIRLNHLTRGELFDLIFETNSKITKENTILKSIVLVDLLVSLICMILHSLQNRDTSFLYLVQYPYFLYFFVLVL